MPSLIPMLAAQLFGAAKGAQAGAVAVDEATGAKAARDKEVADLDASTQLAQDKAKSDAQAVTDLQTQKLATDKQAASVAAGAARRRQTSQSATLNTGPSLTGMPGAGAGGPKTLLGY